MVAMRMLLLGLFALILAFTLCSLEGCGGGSEDAAPEDEGDDDGETADDDDDDDETADGDDDETADGDDDDDDETNPCEGKKPSSNPYFDNVNCTAEDGVLQALEQSGTNVTLGYQGDIDTSDPARAPITTTYAEAGLCPVNVHWHLGAEHLSVGEFDEQGTGPDDHRRLAEDARLGYRCLHYDENDPKFTTEYEWQHCDSSMKVGETYEIHWPHSAAGDCGTNWQYQSPFYDGVFCKDGIVSLDPLNTYSKIGVQAQVFTIVNDESYYYADLFQGMRVDGDYGAGITKYTGSTTGTSRSNTICSKYTPITWQVDRKCHLISASSFDKMCEQMKMQGDDMSMDLHAHGARELVADEFAADNHQRL